MSATAATTATAAATSTASAAADAAKSEDKVDLKMVGELVGFLSHDNWQVRQQAATMLSGLTVRHEQRVQLLQVGARLYRELVTLISDIYPSVARLALASLVNLMQEDEVCAALLRTDIVHRCMNGLREKDFPFKDLYVNVLVNLTRSEKGAMLVLQEGDSVQGLYVLRLMQYFVARPAELPHHDWVAIKNKHGGAGDADPMASIAYVLTNLTQREAGRTLMTDPSRKTLRAMVEHLDVLVSPVGAKIFAHADVRRVGVLQAVRNCAFTPGTQGEILSDDLSFFVPHVLLPLAAPGKYRDDELEEMLPAVRRAVEDSAKVREPNESIRRILVETIILLLKNKPSRLVLRDEMHIYPIMREYHMWERAAERTEIDDLIEEDLIPFLILDEGTEMEELEASKNDTSKSKSKSKSSGDDNKSNESKSDSQQQQQQQQQPKPKPSQKKPVDDGPMVIPTAESLSEASDPNFSRAELIHNKHEDDEEAMVDLNPLDDIDD